MFSGRIPDQSGLYNAERGVVPLRRRDPTQAPLPMRCGRRRLGDSVGREIARADEHQGEDRAPSAR